LNGQSLFRRRREDAVCVDDEARFHQLEFFVAEFVQQIGQACSADRLERPCALDWRTLGASHLVARACNNEREEYRGEFFHARSRRSWRARHQRWRP
jgi:hypothetical protein